MLLPRRDNNSINDQPFAEKIRTYSRQNDLAAILSQNHQGNNPTLRDFTKRIGIESLFQPFSPNSNLEDVAAVRQELYLRLCQRIWDPARLRIGSSALEQVPASPQGTAGSGVRPPSEARVRPKKKLVQSHVGKLVRVGALQPGEKIVGTHNGNDYWASIEDDGGPSCAPPESVIPGSTRPPRRYARRAAEAWNFGTRRARKADESPSANCSTASAEASRRAPASQVCPAQNGGVLNCGASQ